MNQAIYPAHPSSNMAIAIAPLQLWIADAIASSHYIFHGGTR